MNPVFPLDYFICDVEPRVWADGRVYAYGSTDIPDNHSYCSHTYRVLSSADMLTWEDHGQSFATLGADAATPWSTSELFAPDCTFYNGRYYLYFCQRDRSEGVAVSDHPGGPFVDATTIPGPHRDAIDPAVFVDDDGQAYLYWGQYHCRGARLQPDMRHIDESTLKTHLLVEDQDGFHEGASMRKRGDKYYLLYCGDTTRGKATCISYAMGDSPLGPFKRGGVIIDNQGCDPETWNNHGSMVEFEGQWYIFYHRSSRGSRFSRRACVEKIYFDDEGHIAEVEMTTQGAEGPIAATRTIEATRACQLEGILQAESAADAAAGRCVEYLARGRHGCHAAYKYLDFGQGMQRFFASVASLTHGGVIELRLGSADGRCIGHCDVPHTGGWQKWVEVSCEVEPVPGVHALYLVFRQRENHTSVLQIANIESFRFA